MTNDHADQCARIADTAIRIIANEGANAATIRRISAELNCSTTLVTYHFADKKQLLKGIHQALRVELFGKLDRLMSEDPADLVGCLLHMTAAEDVSVARWRTYIAFWDQGVRDTQWAARHRDEVNEFVEVIANSILARNGPVEDRHEIASDLNIFIQGLSIRALLDRESWPPLRLRLKIEEVVSTHLGKPRMYGFRMR